MTGWLFMPVFPVRKPVRAQPKGQCREMILQYQMPCTVKKRKLRWLPMLLMVLCTGSVVLAAGKAVPVVTSEAESRSLIPMQQVAGTLISRNDARLAAQVEGQAVWVAEVGTRLARGEAATRLDDTLICSGVIQCVSLVWDCHAITAKAQPFSPENIIQKCLEFLPVSLYPKRQI